MKIVQGVWVGVIWGELDGDLRLMRNDANENKYLFPFKLRRRKF